MRENQFYLLVTSVVVGLIMLVCWQLGAPALVFHLTLLFFGALITISVVDMIKSDFEVSFQNRVQRSFGAPMSDSALNRLRKQPELLRTDVQKKELTIMFADVSNFVNIIDRPEYDVARISKSIQEFLNLIDFRVINNNGTLGKCNSSGRMSFWNAPFDDLDHAKTAVRAAREILGDVDVFNRSKKKINPTPVEMAFGLSTGTVLVGNMGSDYCSNYNCCGHNVALASWLKEQCKCYGVPILFDEATARQVQDEYVVIELDQVISPAWPTPVHIYTVISADQPQNQLLHKKFLRCYRAAQWDEARVYAQELARVFDGELKDYYALMVRRINDAAKARVTHQG